MPYRCLRRLAPSTVAALLLVTAPVSAAAPRTWEPLGPPGGTPQQLLTTADGRPLAVARGGALWRGDDEGRTWSLAGAVPFRSGVGTVTTDPTDPQRLYAVAFNGDGLRSVDGGATWERFPDPAREHFRPDLAAAATPSGTVLVRLPLARSTDGGATWQPVLSDLGPGDADALEPWPGGDGRFLLSTDRGLYLSHDAGASFAPAGPGLPTNGLPDDEVIGVAAAPSAPDRLHAVLRDGRTFASDDAGESWRQTGDVPRTLNPLAPAHLLFEPDDASRLYAVVDDRLVASDDGGASWHQRDVPGSAVGALLALAGDGALLAAVRGDDDVPLGGVVRSSDGGLAWTLSRQGLKAHDLGRHGLAVAAGEPPVLLVTAQGPLWRRSGGGWIEVPVPLPTPVDPENGVEERGVGDVVAATRDRSRWLVTQGIHLVVPTSSGELRVPGLVVWETRDAGATWEVRFAGETPGVVADAPSRPGRYYFVAGPPPNFRPGSPWCGLVRLVAEDGTSACLQDVFPDTVPGHTADALAVDAADADHVYAVDRGGLFVSGDGGDTWDEPPLPFAAARVASHPRIAGLALVTGEGGELWRSDDGGVTWLPLPGELPEGELSALHFDPLVAERLYALVDGAVYASDDGGGRFQRLGAGLPSGSRVRVLKIDPSDPSVLYAGVAGAGLWRLDRLLPTDPCVADAHTLCLGAGGRFRIRVGWQDFEHATGRGRTVPRTVAPSEKSDTGAFWFFAEDNLELLVKVLDASEAEERFWVFYGALTNVPFTLVVTDTETGETLGYDNPPRRFASRGDTNAFPEVGLGNAAPPPGDSAPPLRDTVEPAPCVPSASALCLGAGDRFRAELAWEDFAGGSGVGTAVPETDDTGFFWFFKDSNLELAVKVLDGRSVNGRFWVFYGALTNVPFRLTVTDTSTGQVRTYVNPSRNFASRGDVDAFDDTQ